MQAQSNKTTTTTSPWMTTEQAAEYLSVSNGTMRNWRSRGEGPRYHLLGGRLVRYEVEDLDAYMREGVA